MVLRNYLKDDTTPLQYDKSECIYIGLHYVIQVLMMVYPLCAYFYSDINWLFNNVVFLNTSVWKGNRYCIMHSILHGSFSVLLVHILSIKPTGHLTACLYKEAPAAGAWQGRIRGEMGRRLCGGGGGLIRLPWPGWFIDSFVCLFRNLICIIHVHRGAVLRTLAG